MLTSTRSICGRPPSLGTFGDMTSTEADALRQETIQLRAERDAAALHVVRCENALRLWLRVVLAGGDPQATVQGVKQAVTVTTEILGIKTG